jgi:hypothetical protein
VVGSQRLLWLAGVAVLGCRSREVGVGPVGRLPMDRRAQEVDSPRTRTPVAHAAEGPVEVRCRQQRVRWEAAVLAGGRRTSTQAGVGVDWTLQEAAPPA